MVNLPVLISLAKIDCEDEAVTKLYSCARGAWHVRIVQVSTIAKLLLI